MTTTSTLSPRVAEECHDITVSIAGEAVGYLSPLTLAAIVDSGLLHPPYESEPQKRLREMSIPAVCFCGEPCAFGVFCAGHFAELAADPGFAVAWHGEDWTRACEQAESEVSHAAD